MKIMKKLLEFWDLVWPTYVDSGLISFAVGPH